MTRGSTIALALVALIAAEARAQEPRGGGALVTQYCAVCHEIAPGKTVSRNKKAPAFAVVAAEPETTAASLRFTLDNPHADMVKIPLTDEQKDAIIRYILSLRQR